MQQEATDPCCSGPSGHVCCVEQLGEVLSSTGRRLTAERQRLTRTVCHMEGHFRPEDVVDRLRDEGHAVSLVTVYRNLPLLVEAGLIRRTDAQDSVGASQYEHIWGHEHHDHLVCMSCRKVIEFSYPAIDILQDAVAAQYGYELVNHRLELLGICPDCRGRDATAEAPTSPAQG